MIKNRKRLVMENEYLELNNIYNLDCINGLRGIKDNSVNLILTDPPYNTTNCQWECDIDLDTIWKEWKRRI